MNMTPSNSSKQIPDIMHYEGKIWAIADDLRAAGINQSAFPSFMMPFFALVMLEGRMKNAVRRLEDDLGFTINDDKEEFLEAFKDEKCGYNKYIVEDGKSLRDVCKGDASFETDLSSYLEAFDSELKRLLGINQPKESLYLDIDGKIGELKAKGVLFPIVAKWAEVDLSPYSNSEITTLEEHIKRKWADMSDAKAGEQYTPNDIIALIADIAAAKVTKPKEENIHIYDPTCGGANLLYGVADRLQKDAGYQRPWTYGSELETSLYALSAIEAQFRDHSYIRCANTLTGVPFAGNKFDLIVANPPYGYKWSAFRANVENDAYGQFFAGLPAVSDGQMLFMQHIMWQLADNGLAIEVHGGSTLFDSGVGETAIRKYMFDKDWVEAIIQMTDNEFFNTPIKTYIWVMNKNKSADRKDKVALIDASKMYKILKKSRGNKRRELTEDHRKTIVDALVNFVPTDICKIYDREYFYYNKQNLVLTELDDNNCAIEDAITLNNLQKIVLESETLEAINKIPAAECKELVAKLKAYDYKELLMDIYLADNEFYRYDRDCETILYFKDGQSHPLGRGAITFNQANSKGLGSVKVVIDKETTSDYEIIPHHFDGSENKKEIDAFMEKYIFKPFELTDEPYVGVELNFNKEFYVPEEIDSVENILAEIKKLDEELGEIEI